jgi:hypothetical protein
MHDYRDGHDTEQADHECPLGGRGHATIFPADKTGRVLPRDGFPAPSVSDAQIREPLIAAANRVGDRLHAAGSLSPVLLDRYCARCEGTGAGSARRRCTAVATGQ